MSKAPNHSSQGANRGNNQGTSPVRKYHGLINQGATCYLNSVLQVLFMTEEFREALMRYQKGQKRGIDLQLQYLFKSLSRETANTTEVTKSLAIKNVHEQHDAAEYFEKILTNTRNAKASEIFKGQLICRTICQCGSKTEKYTPFWNLPLPLKKDGDKTYSVEYGLEEFFADMNFRDENQLYCQRCKNKRDAIVKRELKHHPEVLMLLLKRFEFNYHHMVYMKNTRPVRVPLAITIPEKYELYASVEHFGTLQGGHYKSIIKSQTEGRWYEFDDSHVTLLESQKLVTDHFSKSQSAYLLFYKKKNTVTQDGIWPHKGEKNVKKNRLLRFKTFRSPGNIKSVPSHSNEEVQDIRGPTKHNGQIRSNPEQRTVHINQEDLRARHEQKSEVRDFPENIKRGSRMTKSFHQQRDAGQDRAKRRLSLDSRLVKEQKTSCFELENNKIVTEKNFSQRKQDTVGDDQKHEHLESNRPGCTKQEDHSHKNKKAENTITATGQSNKIKQKYSLSYLKRSRSHKYHLSEPRESKEVVQTTKFGPVAESCSQDSTKNKNKNAASWVHDPMNKNDRKQTENHCVIS